MKKLLASAALVLSLVLSLALSVGAARAAAAGPDSTNINAAGALAASNCPGPAADPVISGNWYPAGAVPAGYYKSNGDGNCYPIPACPSNQVWDGSGQACACPAGTSWDSGFGTCHAPCSGGQVWLGAMCGCPAGQVSNGSSCGVPASFTGFSIAPSALTVGQNFTVFWGASGTDPVTVNMTCAGATSGSYNLAPAAGGSGSIAASAPGSSTCVATASNPWGSANATSYNSANCPTGFYKTPSNTCIVPSPGGCPPGTWYDDVAKTCREPSELVACPPSVWAWTSGPRIPLAQANPTRNLPDGHPWCYYQGRGIAGGANDGGDPWAVAFDRVTGTTVTFYPYYTETPDSVMTYAGLIPYYGAPSNPYSTTLASLGGSKCAPGNSYEQAWYPSDCDSGHSSLSLSGSTPYGGWCVLDLRPDNPLVQMTGQTRIQNGGALVLGAAPMARTYSATQTTSDGFSYTKTYSISVPLGSSGSMGCRPGMPSILIQDATDYGSQG